MLCWWDGNARKLIELFFKKSHGAEKNHRTSFLVASLSYIILYIKPDNLYKNLAKDVYVSPPNSLFFTENQKVVGSQSESSIKIRKLGQPVRIEQY